MKEPKVYILNTNFTCLGILDDYISFLWIPRYREVGECEIVVPATTQALELFHERRYIYNTADDSMLCRIEKIRLRTSIDDGNTLIISGVDMKKLLNQRVIWDTVTADRAKAEVFARALVKSALGSDADSYRQVKNGNTLIFGALPLKGFADIITEQVSYKNLGEKIREYCQRFDWGYKVDFTFNAPSGKLLKFGLYKGVDKSQSIVFSPNFDNLIESNYEKDLTNLANIALVAGEGRGANRSRAVSGNTSQATQPRSVNRYEIYVDARQITKEVTYNELVTAYPGGYVTTEAGIGTPYVYKLSTLNIQIVNQDHRYWLVDNYPSGRESVLGVFTVTDVAIASVPSASPSNNDVVTLRDVVYLPYLYILGDEKLSEYGTTTTFNGSIEPNVTYTYGTDYNLGDLVTVRNEYGISQAARIMEVVEAWDEQGYHVEPKFEYIDKVNYS